MIVKRLLLVLGIVLSSIFCFSQNTGYAGKKFILKSSFLNGNSAGLYLGAEYALSKHLSINVGLGMQQKTAEQIVTDSEVNYYLTTLVNPPQRRSDFGVATPKLPAVNLDRRSVRLSLKTYLNRVVNRAPKGFFFEYGFEAGVCNISNASIFAEISNRDNTGNVNGIGFINNVSVDNMNFNSIELMAGFQEIFSSRIAVELTFGFNTSTFNTNGTEETFAVSNLSAPRYNNNLFNFDSFGGLGFPDTSVGITGYLRIGYLLF